MTPMPDLDALRDEALGQVVWRALEQDASPAPLGWNEPDAGQTSVDVRMRQQFCQLVARAVRDHILRVLAEQAGDPEALAEVVHDALSEKYEPDARVPYRRLAPNIQEDARRAAQAVAARAVAPLAAEVLVGISGPYTFPGTIQRALTRSNGMIDAALTRPLPDAAKRVEAVLDAARKAVELRVADGSIPPSPAHVLAEALRALEGGEGS